MNVGMTVGELIEKLKGVDPKLFVEFHDLTYAYICPVKSAIVQVGRDGADSLIMTTHPEGRSFYSEGKVPLAINNNQGENHD